MTSFVDLWQLRGRVVIIAEKPKAASKIASAVLPSYRKIAVQGIPLYVYKGNGLEVTVASAAGHIFNLSTKLSGYPVFSYEWAPSFEVDKRSLYIKKFYLALVEACRGRDYYINACDYDIEGSVIGFLIIKFLGDPKRALRAKFSSLTPAELRESFKRLTRLDYEMIEAGLARHELDWLWGVNISRALMSAVERAVGKRVILSAGRVQTPTLAYVAQQLTERNHHIPYPIFLLSIVVEKNSARVSASREKGVFETQREALRVASLIKEKKHVQVEDYTEEKVSVLPPFPFNLGDLQEEAYRIYGFSPYKTQEIAERLYLEALISYPRTNSQKLPPTLNYRTILDQLAENPVYRSLVAQLLSETGGRLKPREGPKDDPAHPAIYPTGVKPPHNLPPDMLKVYDLVVRRFLAVFSRPYELVRQRVVFSAGVPGETFYSEGQYLVKKGWLSYYYFHTPEERRIPVFRKGELVRVVEVDLKRMSSKPPNKPTKMSILKWMESVEIGTESTRARIIETLFDRGYLKMSSKGVEITDLGLGVIEVIEEFFPELTKVELTREFEKSLEDIRAGKTSRSIVVEKAKQTLSSLIEKFEPRKSGVGKELAIRLGLIAPASKCIICGRQALSGNMCRYHYEAYKRLKEGYLEWSRREDVSFQDYLKQVVKSKSTGKWVKEVAEAVLRGDVLGLG
ncbi:DNA topoisomerase I [Thermogladius sp. KZ2Tp1]|uniref:DNA topoisomerase I n=1 Tax=Thermogladius sp. KZ2Tp1 TaxID=3136289 RepID=UPI003DA86855